MIMVYVAKVYQRDYPIFEEGMYGAYTVSILNDGDFNVFNQATDRSTWLATKTYNHPDMHNSTIPVLLFPFYMYNKYLHLFFGEKNSEKNPVIYKDVHILANIFFSTFFLLLCYRTMKFLFNTVNITLFVFFFLGTAYTWYTFFCSTAPDIPATVVSAMILIYYLKLITTDSSKNIRTTSGFNLDFFLFGGILFLGAFCRPQIMFYNLLLIDYLFFLKGSHYKKDAINKIISYSGGAIFISVLFFTNVYLQYGTIDYIYRYVADPKFFPIFSIMFGPNGHFFISPIYLLVIIGMATAIFSTSNKTKPIINNTHLNRKSLLIILAMIPSTRIIATSFRAIGHDQGFAGRLLIVDYLIFIFFILYLYNTIVTKNLCAAFAIKFFAIISAAWSFALLMWYKVIDISGNSTWGSIYPSNIRFISEYFKVIYLQIMTPAYFSWGQDFHETVILIPIVLLCSYIIYRFISVKNFSNILSWSLIRTFSIILISSYLGMTLLNTFNNKKNIETERKLGKFDKIVIGTEMDIYVYDDFLDSINEAIKSAEYNRKHDIVIILRKSLQNYIDKIKKQISVDPINIKDDFKQGIIRPSYWSTQQ